jgi:hypothetical protein
MQSREYSGVWRFPRRRRLFLLGLGIRRDHRTPPKLLVRRYCEPQSPSCRSVKRSFHWPHFGNMQLQFANQTMATEFNSPGSLHSFRPRSLDWHAFSFGWIRRGGPLPITVSSHPTTIWTRASSSAVRNSLGGSASVTSSCIAVSGPI